MERVTVNQREEAALLEEFEDGMSIHFQSLREGLIL
jgi:hypothetical protein